jgi:hypothetical protein
MISDYSLNFKFNFLTGNDITNVNNWGASYMTNRTKFINADINSSAFENSFFKLDYYDTPFNKSQKLYFTIILQAKNGIKSNDIVLPEYFLDYDLNTEGFYIYWLRDKTIFNLDTFYVRVSFFNGKTGNVTNFSNVCQGATNITDRYNLNEVFDFYYRLDLDYDTKTYEYFDIKQENKRVGVKGSPITWYEYISR